MNSDFETKSGDAIEAACKAVEVNVLSIITHRLATLDPQAPLAEAFSQMPADLAKIDAALESGARDVSKAAETVVAKVAADSAEWGAEYYAAAGIAFDAAVLDPVIEAGAVAAVEGVRARVNTSVVGLTTGNGVLPIREAYVDIVSRAAADMATGTASGKDAVLQATRAALTHLCDNGVRVQYRSGVTRDLAAAVSQNVMSAYRKTMHDARWEMGSRFGADGVEVSAHALCAPDHLPYQGRQFTMSEYEEINRTLDRPLVDGANCRHIAYPILLGVSKSAYSEEYLDALKRESEREVTVNGKTMTRYEATQVQRRLERAIRAARMEAGLLEREGLDASESTARLKALQARYRTVSNEAELETRRERTLISLPR